MYCVGLMGNIASGKSTVASFFKRQEIDVISADKIARELTASNQPAFYSIVNHFGHSIINGAGELDRQTLRAIIFSDPKQRLWLEKLLHPLIREHILHKITEVQSPYCLIEIPLLNDRADYPYLNRVLLVMADREQQVERVMLRDKVSREQALAILAAQPKDLKRREFADDIIINNGSLSELSKKIEKLHHQYLELATQKD